MAKGKGKGAGRPRMYDEEFILALIPKLEKWCKNPESYWLGDFAIENGLYRELLPELAERSQEFALALKKAKTVQEKRLIEKGFSSRSPAMAVFALKNVAGWRDIPADQQTQVFNIVIGSNGQAKQLGELVEIGKRKSGDLAIVN